MFVFPIGQNEVRAQDSVFVIVSVAMNPKGRDMCWEFFKSNSAKLLAQYEVIKYIGDLVHYLQYQQYLIFGFF